MNGFKLLSYNLYFIALLFIPGMECIESGMEFIRTIGDSENMRLVIKNKIQEFKDEKKMSL